MRQTSNSPPTLPSQLSAWRATVSVETTTSPSGESPGGEERGGWGKAITSVGPFLPNQRRLSPEISRSSTRTTLISAGGAPSRSRTHRPRRATADRRMVTIR